MVMSMRPTSFFDDGTVSLKERWTSEARKNICLAIWVDCQHMQVASTSTAVSESIYRQRIEVSKCSEVLENFGKISRDFASNECTVVFTTMSFAGPVSQDHVVITNWRCEPRERVIHFTQLPFDLFPLDRRRFMNNMEAASYGIVSRFKLGDIQQLFEKLWDCGTEKEIGLDGSSLVLSVGAGLGVSFICRNDASDHNCVVSSEAGHGQAVTCSRKNPQYATEIAFIKYVSQKLHGGSHQPEWEDLCSERGLELAYQFLNIQKQQHIDKCPNYGEIRDKAMTGKDPEALEAFKMHYAFVMRAIQSMVLGIHCQRVFLVNEVQFGNLSICRKLSNYLREVFEDHPSSRMFNNIPVYVQRKESKSLTLHGSLFVSRILAYAQQRQVQSV